MKDKEFALQLNVAIDVIKDSHLIYYIRFINEGCYVLDILFFKKIIYLYGEESEQLS